MTNLGFQTVYHLFNGLDRVVCERAFLPSKEDMDEFTRTGTQLFSYESQTPIREFDIIAFSVPFEDDYMNIPRILDLAEIPVFSSERGAAPVIIAGGVAISLNPEPVAEFIDLFLIGEGEGSLLPFIDLFRRLKEEGLSKGYVLKGLDSIKWAYVPSLYEFSYDGAKIKEVKAAPGAKEKVLAAKNFDLDKFDVPENYILTPDTEFKDTFLMEVERGCGRGCRFCAAGFLYLPPRWRDVESIKGEVKKGIDATGKVGLIGTAVSEYPEIKETLSFGIENNGVLTLSSLRLDKLDEEFLALLKKGGYKTITLAPEAGTERMRNVVNKGITDAEIMESIRLIAEAGFLKVKLYYLIGLPSETDIDAEGIVELTLRIKEVMKRGEITLSINPFIPKPFTPFQWSGFEDAGTVDRRLSIITKGLSKERSITIHSMSAKEAFIQAYIARADRRAGAVILEASKSGWKRAIKSAGQFLPDSVYLGRSKEDILPWDILDHGVKKTYLWKEHQKGLKGILTPPCDVGNCFRCGVC
ncbi:MAG: radical SAM protein [Deltaproteobacteria bacterium]|nr:radical SAM protein [Deltaproteobacteria bacterium]